MKRQTLSKKFIIVTIILIAGFQSYWITRLYNQDLEGLRKETNLLFRDVVYKLQLQQFKNDTALFKQNDPDNLFAFDMISGNKQGIIDSIRLKDTTRNNSGKKRIMISMHKGEILKTSPTGRKTDTLDLPSLLQGPPIILRYISRTKNLNDSLPLSTIDSAYKADLAKNNIDINYTLKCMSGNVVGSTPLKSKADRIETNFTFTGLSRSYAYQAEFGNPHRYLLGKLRLPITISLLLIALTILCFVFLYRNLKTQQRLVSIKNEFISNITHELKTPIATVNVAIEALRNFNALQDPVKTKEYLDISASELQRLSLLVDKVLRLSMFENGQVALKKENFDLKILIEEVLATMQLQVEKQKATVTLKADGGHFIIEADRMHIASVLYNLIDNALKYKSGDPEIEIALKAKSMHIELTVRDNGIGIPAVYRLRIFEKLFRVPTENVHNVKGYGLGLSYVNYIVRRHLGFIEVTSELGKGTVFTVYIPYKEMDEIWFDDKRRISRKHFGISSKKQA